VFLAFAGAAMAQVPKRNCERALELVDSLARRDQREQADEKLNDKDTRHRVAMLVLDRMRKASFFCDLSDMGDWGLARISLYLSAYLDFDAGKLTLDEFSAVMKFLDIP